MKCPKFELTCSRTERICNRYHEICVPNHENFSDNWKVYQRDVWKLEIGVQNLNYYSTWLVKDRWPDPHVDDWLIDRKTSRVIVFSLTYLQNKTTVYRGGCSDFLGEQSIWIKTGGGERWTLIKMGGGQHSFTLFGGGNKFYQRTLFWKKIVLCGHIYYNFAVI